jgi:hypothetical protein
MRVTDWIYGREAMAEIPRGEFVGDNLRTTADENDDGIVERH